jgi:hypothetical protein
MSGLGTDFAVRGRLEEFEFQEMLDEGWKDAES